MRFVLERVRQVEARVAIAAGVSCTDTHLSEEPINSSTTKNVLRDSAARTRERVSFDRTLAYYQDSDVAGMATISWSASQRCSHDCTRPMCQAKVLIASRAP
jgi:hypothetical protein